MATTSGLEGRGQEKKVDVNNSTAIAFLGPAHSYTHQATKIAFSEDKWQLEPTVTIKEVFERVQAGQARFGVVPFENSTHGAVTFTLDSLADRAGALADIVVRDEVYLDVHHFLLGRFPPPASSTTTTTTTSPTLATSQPPSSPTQSSNDNDNSKKGVPLTSLSHLRRIYSHPQAFGQSAAFLARYLPPGAEKIDVSSTSRAAELAAADTTGASAAVASEWAGVAAGLDVLARWVEDRGDNVTRFFVLESKRGGREEEGEKVEDDDGDAYGGGKYKSLVSFTVPHRRPGALADVLDCFRGRALNLTSISSVPSLDAPFQYLFFVEFEGSQDDDPEGRVKAVLEDLGRVAERWRWLGSWQNRRVAS